MLLSEDEHEGKMQTMKVLCEFLNHDILGDEEEEVMEVIRQWHEKPNVGKEFGVEDEDAARVRKLAEPFFAWVEEADEDEEEIVVSY